LCDGDDLTDILRNGQGVLNVLPLAGVKNDVDASIVTVGRRVEADAEQRRAAGM
jgi:hypothetical protein